MFLDYLFTWNWTWLNFSQWRGVNCHGVKAKPRNTYTIFTIWTYLRVPLVLWVCKVHNLQGTYSMDAYRGLRSEWPQLLRQCRPFLPSKLLGKSSLAWHHGGPRTVAKYNTKWRQNSVNYMKRRSKHKFLARQSVATSPYLSAPFYLYLLYPF